MTDEVSAGLDGGLDETTRVLLETVEECLSDNDPETLRLVLNDVHGADLAEVMKPLGEVERLAVFEVLAPELASQVLSELDTTSVLSVSEAIPDDTVAELVQNMAPDDAADTLGSLPDDLSERVLDLMDEDEAREARDLLEHPPDSGGGIMNPDLVAVAEDLTVSGAIEHLRQWGEADHVFYVYAVDRAGRLLGTVSLRRLVIARPDQQIRSIMDPDPVSVTPAMDQEEIARIFDRYDYLALPVVGEDGRLMGQITVDDIVDVIHEEATEDFYEMAGTSSDELEERSIFGVVRRRMPWLVVCLVGTLLSGGVIEVFSDVLANLIALSLFVPAIMAMGGNTGIQTSTVTVRSLATGQVHLAGTLRLLWREVRVSLVMGSCLGLLVSAVAYVWTGSGVVGACVGLSMISAVVLSASIGAVLPLTFWRLGIDPAVASGPLITTMNDIISLTAYFSLAVILLRSFPM